MAFQPRPRPGGRRLRGKGGRARWRQAAESIKAGARSLEPPGWEIGGVSASVPSPRHLPWVQVERASWSRPDPAAACCSWQLWGLGEVEACEGLRPCRQSDTESLIITIKSVFRHVLRYPFLGGCLGCVRGPPPSLPLAHAASSPKLCFRNTSRSPEKGTSGAEFALNPAREQPLKAKQPGRGERSVLACFPASPSACALKRGDYRGPETTPLLLGFSPGRSFPAQQRRGGKYPAPRVTLLRQQNPPAGTLLAAARGFC